MDHVPWNAHARLFCGAEVAADGVLGSCVASWRGLRPARQASAYILCDALVWLSEWDSPTPLLDLTFITQVSDRQGRRSLEMV
jgi:hypothetical protein